MAMQIGTIGICKSILDTDAYKLTQSYAYQTLYPLAEGTFTYTDRSNETWTKEQFDNLNRALHTLSVLKLNDAEFSWVCENMYYVPRPYWEWLRQFRFDPNKIKIELDDESHLHIEVTDLMYKVTLYEVPILKIVSSIRNEQYHCLMSNVECIAHEKALFALEHNLKFADFGTRRCFSHDVHDKVLEVLFKECPTCCVGTSNVHLAMKYGVKPIGTMAHEWFMFHAGCFGFQRANYLALEDWVQVFDGNLGIALVDTYTTESFLRTLTLKQAKLFDGMRQDSGDEYKVGNMIIDRYKEFGIDPTTKTIVFSNALTLDKWKDIQRYFDGKIKVSAGIGTFLTCDPGIEGYKAANIVMKLTRCRLSAKDPWEDVIKISDDFGKHMGNPELFEIAKKVLHLNIAA